MWLVVESRIYDIYDRRLQEHPVPYRTRAQTCIFLQVLLCVDQIHKVSIDPSKPKRTLAKANEEIDEGAVLPGLFQRVDDDLHL
jgi:hypothetical protein